MMQGMDVASQVNNAEWQMQNDFSLGTGWVVT